MEFVNETATQKHKRHWFLTIDKKSKWYHKNQKVQCVYSPEVATETNDSDISFKSETSWSGNGPLSIAQSICKKNKTIQCKPIYRTSCVQAVTTTK